MLDIRGCSHRLFMLFLY